MTDYKLLRKIVKVARENPQFKKALMPIIKEAMEFPTKDALEKYLHDHPDADKSKHKVVKTKKQQDRTTVPAKFKKDDSVSKLFAEYVYHSAQGSGEDQDKAVNIEKQLETKGFTSVDASVHEWPLAKKHFIKKCKSERLSADAIQDFLDWIASN